MNWKLLVPCQIVLVCCLVISAGDQSKSLHLLRSSQGTGVSNHVVVAGISSTGNMFGNMTLTKVMLYILHFLITLKAFCLKVVEGTTKTLSLQYKKRTLNSIREDSKRLVKCPSHLGFVVVEENISYCDLAKVLVWSAAMGITCVTIYDKLGFVKRNKTRLENHISEQLEVPEKKKYNFNIHIGYGKKEGSAGSNGCMHVEVYLLSVEDGRQRIVDSARGLARAVTNNQYCLNDITPCNIDAIFQEEQGFLDPQLVVRFGPTASLLGYLPWHIRLTEILSLPSHHHIDYVSFFRLIQSYGHTEQRFGK